MQPPPAQPRGVLHLDAQGWGCLVWGDGDCRRSTASSWTHTSLQGWATSTACASRIPLPERCQGETIQQHEHQAALLVTLVVVVAAVVGFGMDRLPAPCSLLCQHGGSRFCMLWALQKGPFLPGHVSIFVIRDRSQSEEGEVALA